MPSPLTVWQQSLAAGWGWGHRAPLKAGALPQAPSSWAALGWGVVLGQLEFHTLIATSTQLPLHCSDFPTFLLCLSLYLSICLFPSQVQTPDKSVSPLFLSLFSLLLALWVAAPPCPGCSPALSHLPSFPPTQQVPLPPRPHLPPLSAVTITHAHHIPGGAAPGAHRARGPEPHPSYRQLLRPPVPDASKQRLMENTEDWRPRPGMGQSRSFRILAHLTGTEFSKCRPSSGRTLLASARG